MSENKGRSSHQKRRLKERLFRGRLRAPCCFCRKVLFPATATLDHFLPLSLGGGWDVSNLRLSCEECNSERKAEDFTAFRNRKRGVTWLPSSTL